MKPREELLKLLNLELDGELDCAGTQRINKLCADDPDLAAIRAGYSTLNRHLAAMPVAEPPEDLRRSILMRLDERAGSNSERAPTHWLASLLEMFSIPRVRWASSFALVVIAATIGLYWAAGPGSESGIEENSLSGTLGSPVSSVDKREIVQSVLLDELEGVLVLRRVATGVELEVRLQSASDLLLDIVPAEASTIPSPVSGGPVPGITLTREANRVHLSGNGEVWQKLAWRTSQEPVHISVRAYLADEAVGEWQLSLD